MLYDEIISVIIFSGLIGYFFQLGWNMSGIPEYELRDIRKEFKGAEAFLRPLVIDATQLRRRLLRVLPLLNVNLSVLWMAYQAVHHEDLASMGWPALLVLGTVEWLMMVWVVRKNRKKYRADLEECRMLCHPDVRRLEGSIEDRPTGRCKANHTVSGGRIIRVLGQAGAYQDLFLPLAWYAVRRVEETQGPVVVFFLEWKKSGFSEDHVFPPRPAVVRVDPELSDKSNSAMGVYLGFRHNPALAAKAAVWTRPVEERGV